MFVGASSLAFPQAAYLAQARAGGNGASSGTERPALAVAPADGASTTPAVAPPFALASSPLAREQLAGQLADFAASAGNKLRAAGVRVPPEPMLAVGSDGMVTVVNEHPDRQQIDRLFASDAELSQEFSTLAAGAEAVQVADDQQQLAQQYQALEGNSKAQQSLLAEASARNGRLRFHLVLTPHGPEYFFPGVLRASA